MNKLFLFVGIFFITLSLLEYEHTAKQQRAVIEALRTNTGEVLVVREPTWTDNKESIGGNSDVETTGGSVPGSEEIYSYIREVFQTPEAISWAISVCMCESNCSPDAVSPSGKYIGIYQFDNNTFDSNCDGSIYEWRDQVVCAEKLYDKGETGRWPNCP